jgi:hypothetical protein
MKERLLLMNRFFSGGTKTLLSIADLDGNILVQGECGPSNPWVNINF